MMSRLRDFLKRLIPSRQRKLRQLDAVWVDGNPIDFVLPCVGCGATVPADDAKRAAGVPPRVNGASAPTTSAERFPHGRWSR